MENNFHKFVCDDDDNNINRIMIMKVNFLHICHEINYFYPN